MITLTTPTGQIGHHLLATLLQDGAPLRVVARDPGRLPEAARGRAEVVAGSHDDPAVLDAALVGTDALFLVVPPDFGAPDVDAHYLRFAHAAAAALRRHPVARVVMVATLGRGWTGAPAGHLTAALAAADALAPTAPNLRVLSPPFFMENLLHQAGALRDQGAFFLTSRADRVLPLVATRDIADAAARLLQDDAWTGQEDVPLASPDALTPDTMAEVLTGVLGRPIAYHAITTEAYRSTLLEHGAAPGWADGLATMADAQNAGIYDPHLAAARGTAPTTFRAWARETLA